jgi:4'-phosphopantetheinyl transferase
LASFYAIWTRKEAFIKAVGLGLSLPLNAFDVAGDPSAAGRLLAVRHAGYRAESWSLSDVDVGPGHRAALALEGSGAAEHSVIELTDTMYRALLHDAS